jgi:hypothetical protein
LDLDILKVRLECPAANARNLSADPAQVLGLAAASVLIAENWFLAANRALHTHFSLLLMPLARF